MTHPWATLYGMDNKMIDECEAAWRERNKDDGPEWENNARYKTEFAAGFAAGRGGFFPKRVPGTIGTATWGDPPHTHTLTTEPPFAGGHEVGWCTCGWSCEATATANCNDQYERHVKWRL